MKLSNLIKEAVDVYDFLNQNREQIMLDFGPKTFRGLQTQLVMGDEAPVRDWLIKNGYMDEEKLPFEEIDALHENEEYCPKCAAKIRESIKKSINELMEKEKPGLWANIRAKRKRVGKAGMAKKGSKAYKTAKKAGDEINKDVDEGRKKKKCKPSKGKRFAKRVDGKCRSFGQKGKASDGGDRIRPGTKKAHAYCARSAKIKKCKNPPCANTLSRKKWKCQGSRSVPE